ncbi:MAG: DUF5686 family protein [Ignavibacteriaceae bacterium]|jgi:hypothetical protein
MEKRICISLIIYLSLCFSNTQAQQLDGFVYDEQMRSLPGVNIYLKNTNTGTAANLDGRYIIKLNEGSNTIIFSCVGFISDTLNLTIDRGELLTKNIILKSSPIELPEVIIYAIEISEAEKIIRKAIANKIDYLKKIRNYIYDAYTKTVLLVPSDDSLRYGGVLQTLSKAFYQYPDKFQEVILAKNQTKNITEANNIFSIGKIPNVLEEYITLDDERIISPLSINALDYYSYALIDTSFLSNQRVFNLEFAPKNNNLPLFHGKISIVDNAFTVAAVELTGEKNIITKDRQKIIIREKFRQYENFFWLPVEIFYGSEVNIGIPGIPPIYFNQTSLISDYKINDSAFSYKFDKYILKQSILSSNKADSLWEIKQSIPLTKEETTEVRRIDSIVTNANFLTSVAVGLPKIYTAFNTLPITNFNDFYHFNRVEGNYLGFGLDSKKEFEPATLKFSLGYGISDKKFKYYAFLNYGLFNNIFSPFVEIFDRLALVDKFYEYYVFDITYQSIFNKNDYADYFYRKGFKTGFTILFNDYINSSLSVSSERHATANNNTSWSLFNKGKQYNPSFLVNSGKINALTFSLEYKDLKYYDLGFTKAPDYSDNFTAIRLDYIYSLKALKSDFAFHQIHLDINRFQKILPYVNLNLFLKGGVLLGERINQFKFHLPGNYGTFGSQAMFRTISSDDYLGDKYFAFFVENNFKNTVFNLLGIPFFKQNKYDLLFFYNWALMQGDIIKPAIVNKLQTDHYYEIGCGIGNILLLMRLDFTWRLSKQKTNSFVISLSSTL